MKKLEKNLFAVLKSHRHSMALLHFEQRAEGQAPKRVHLSGQRVCPAAHIHKRIGRAEACLCNLSTLQT